MADLPEALRDLAPVTHDMQDTLKAEVLFKAADRIEALEAENKRLMQWNADMVAKAAAGGVLNGYREMGARIAALEADNAELRKTLFHCITDLETLAHSEFDGIWTDDDFDKLTARFRAALARQTGGEG